MPRRRSVNANSPRWPAPLERRGAAEFERNLSDRHTSALVKQAPRDYDRHRAFGNSQLLAAPEISECVRAEFSRSAGKVPASHDCLAVEAYAWHDGQAATIPRCCLWSATHWSLRDTVAIQPACTCARNWRRRDHRSDGFVIPYLA